MLSKGKLNPVGLVWSWAGEFGQELNRRSHFTLYKINLQRACLLIAHPLLNKL
jgi:hypothetical protein